MKARRQGLMRGAAILAAAGIIVKGIGALFKIPLGAILGPIGMADFSIAYNIYALLFVLSTAGVPVAVSKMIAEECALHQYDGARRVFHIAMASFAGIGAAASTLLFFQADFFARSMGSPSAASAIRAIAPAIFFVSVASICRGYYQGRSNMLPTAISEILEALGKLFVGLAAALWLSRRGFPVATVDAGAVLGVTAGAAVSCAFLLLRRRGGGQGAGEIPSRRAVLKRLFSTAIPITLGASIISLTNVIDSAIVMRLLQQLGCTVEEARWLFGSYNYATTIFNLPGVMITTLGVSLVPAIAASAARGSCADISQTIESSLRVAMLFAIPAALGLFALGEPVIYLLYGGHVEYAAIREAGRMLSLLAAAIPPLAVSSVSAAVLQALGDVKFPMCSMACGAALKVMANWALVGIPQIHIYGACFGTLLCYLTIAAMNAFRLARRAELHIEFSRVFLKTTLCGLLTGVCAKLVLHAARTVYSDKIAVLFSVFSGIFVCFLAAILLRVLTQEDILLFFGKKRITKFLKNH